MRLPGAIQVPRPDLPRGPYTNPSAGWKVLLHGVECPPTTDLLHIARTHPTPPQLWGAPAINQLIQNFDTSVAGMALRSPNNNDRVIQIELALYSTSDDDTDPRQGPEDYLNPWLDWIAERVIVPLFRSDEHDFPLIAPEFIPYPSSYGPSRVRFSREQWIQFSGVCAHMHSPYPDDHGDVGALNVKRILDTAKKLTSPVPVPKPNTDLRDWFVTEEVA